MKKLGKYALVLILNAIILFAYSEYRDNREKSLKSSIIHYKDLYFKSLVIKGVDTSQSYSWQDELTRDELLCHMKQYCTCKSFENGK